VRIAEYSPARVPTGIVRVMVGFHMASLGPAISIAVTTGVAVPLKWSESFGRYFAEFGPVMSPASYLSAVAGMRSPVGVVKPAELTLAIHPVAVPASRVSVTWTSPKLPLIVPAPDLGVLEPRLTGASGAVIDRLPVVGAAVVGVAGAAVVAVGAAVVGVAGAAVVAAVVGVAGAAVVAVGAAVVGVAGAAVVAAVVGVAGAAVVAAVVGVAGAAVVAVGAAVVGVAGGAVVELVSSRPGEEVAVG
jgi:hypothetical protein